MKYFICVVTYLLSFQALKAQTDSVYTGNLKSPGSIKNRKEKNYDWLKKFTYEGNLQFRMSNYTYVYLSPAIGYNPVKRLNAGLGVIYNYISINYGLPYGKVSQAVFGGHSYARYFVTDGFFIQAQYDKLRQPDVFFTQSDQKKWVDYALAGVGFRKALGDKIGITGTFLYNLTPGPLSIYPGRIVAQFGFIGGF